MNQKIVVELATRNGGDYRESRDLETCTVERYK